MSFTADITDRESCEKCKKPSQPGNLVIQLWQATRSEKNVIYIHQNCLNRAVENAVVIYQYDKEKQ